MGLCVRGAPLLEKILAPLVKAMTALMVFAGPFGVLGLMAIESACVPLPSEVIMPFAGFLAFKGQMTLFGWSASPHAQVWIAAVFGALGCNLGSLPAYEVGAWGGRRAVERYGRYIFLNLDHLDLAHRFFERHGRWAILAARMLPVIRTFIAFPAGVARMKLVPFHLYTFIGSWPFCLVLAIVGRELGEKWDSDPRVKAFFHRADLAIGVVLVLLVGFYIWHRVRGLKRAQD